MTKRDFIRTVFTLVLLLIFTEGCTVVDSNMQATDSYYNSYSSVNTDSIPPAVFYDPPHLIVIPETYIYAVPDVGFDIFFYNGWWWRSWQGRWYQSRHYNSGWVYYRTVPSFYRHVPRHWRGEYRNHRWKGYQWNYQRIPYKNVEQNWSQWEKRRHWEKEHNWGVKSLKPEHRDYNRQDPIGNPNRYDRDRNRKHDRFNPRIDYNNSRDRDKTIINPERNPHNNDRHNRVNQNRNNYNKREQINNESDKDNQIKEPFNPSRDNHNRRNRREDNGREELVPPPHKPKKENDNILEPMPERPSQPNYDRFKHHRLDPIDRR